MEWKTVKLGELYDVHNGLSKGAKFFGSGYPFLSFKTVFNNYFLPRNLTDLVQTDEKERNIFDIRRGDVFVTRTSETAEELGMSSVALQDYPQATFNGFTKRLRPKGTDVIPEFVGYYLRSSLFRDKFYGLTSSMSTRASLANGDLLNMEINLPPLDIQRRIADILYAIDSKINNNYLINANLEAQAQALYKSWFVDFEPWGGVMPEDWKEGKLGEFCTCYLGGTPSRAKAEYWNGDIPWINSGEVNNFRITQGSEMITELGLRKSATKLLPKKTTVLAITGATLGQVSLLEIDACANQSVIGILENDVLPYEYIYPMIQNDIEYIILHQTGGAQQHINKDNVESHEIVVPLKEVMSKYKQLAAPIYETIAKNCFESQRLAQLRDTLLPKLMKGEIKL